MLIDFDLICCTITSRLPTQPEIRESWIQFIHKHTSECNLPKSVFLCSLHFEPYCFDTRSANDRLKKNSVPTVFSNDHYLWEVSKTKHLCQKKN